MRLRTPHLHLRPSFPAQAPSACRRGAPTGRRSAPPDDRLRASPESMTTTGSMDSRPAHPSRLLPTWTMILPNSGKPEVGGASTMCNCTSGNDECGTPSSIFKQQPLFANAASRSRRAFRASFAINLPPSPVRGRGERRAPLAPAASCALCIGRKHTSNNEYLGITRRSRTQWFYGLLRALPGDRALLPPSSNGLRSCPRPVGPTNLRELDTSIGVSEPHDFTVRISAVRQPAV
jgi:hypothetical protein